MENNAGKRKMNFAERLFLIYRIFVMALCVNSFFLLRRIPALIPVFLLIFLLVNLRPVLPSREIPSFRLRICRSGTACLVIFLWTCGISVIFHIAAAFVLLPDDWQGLAGSASVCLCTEALLFWNGMIRVYACSVQLGIRHRVIGILCGFIPVVNLILLVKIIRIVSDEISFETEKEKLELARENEQVCRTKYPVLLVHGVFFRDRRFLNYWGRIQGTLIRNGARIFYGNHESAASVPDAAAELSTRIQKIVADTGCGKVNIIAHSKGGLDCRWALNCLDTAPYVASLTTINTPHHGCEFADYLLNKIPKKMQLKIAGTYNTAMKKMGDKHPDFMAAVSDLTAERCEERNRLMKDSDAEQNIVCKSVGSRLDHASGGKFPLNFTYPLVKYFDGPNDGLVAESSCRWGTEFQFLTAQGKRGISHGDVIDLNRENIPGFDVREFYVRLLSDLKKRGL